MKRFVVWLGLCTMLAGCEGWLGKGSPIFGGGDDGDDDTAQSAVGLWSGTQLNTTDNTLYSLRGAVASTGKTFWIGLNAAQNFAFLYMGDTSVSKTAFTSTNRRYAYSGQGFYLPEGTTRFSGNVYTRSSLTASLTTTIDGTTSLATASASYLTSYGKASSLTTLSGNYAGTQNDTSAQTLSVDSSGGITGGQGACQFTGMASVIDSSKNLYTVTLEFASGCAAIGTMKGWAYVNYDSSGNKAGITVAAEADDHAAAYSFFDNTL